MTETRLPRRHWRERTGGALNQPGIKPGKWFARQQVSDDGAYQVDLVVAFFSVLLVLFVVYSARAYSEITNTSRMTYHPADINTRPFGLRSFSPLYPYRDYWIVKDGQVARLDFARIAKRYSETNSLAYENTIDGADVYVTPHETEITSYEIRLLLFEKNIPEWLISGKLSFLDAKTDSPDNIIASNIVKNGRGAFFFIWDDQVQSFSKTLESLSKKGFPYDSYVLKKDKNEIVIWIRSGAHALRNILRAY